MCADCIGNEKPWLDLVNIQYEEDILHFSKSMQMPKPQTDSSESKW